MLFDKALVREKLLEWEETLLSYSLPEWDAFPTLPLYMDQVIFLLNQYLSPLPQEEAERQVTPAMINNYVKLKIIPAPVKKRYGRVHLSYLIMVCVMKQTLNTGEIRRLLPAAPEEAQAKAVYAEFVGAYREMKEYFRRQVRAAAQPVLAEEAAPVSRLIFQASAAANLSKLLTEQLILLRREEPPEAEKK